MNTQVQQKAEHQNPSIKPGQSYRIESRSRMKVNMSLIKKKNSMAQKVAVYPGTILIYLSLRKKIDPEKQKIMMCRMNLSTSGHKFYSNSENCPCHKAKPVQSN